MRVADLSRMTLAAGILALALSGCGSSSSEGTGNGGSTVPPTESGGATSSGGSASGGVTSSGGSASGGVTSSGGSASGGSLATGGAVGTGGRSTGTGGNTTATGGRTGTGTEAGGNATGGLTGATGGAVTGGTPAATGGRATGGTTGGGAGGTGTGTGGSTGRGGSTGTNPGTCTASKDTGKSVTGTGPHKVVIETNTDPGINCGTIYRPADLGGTEKYPIFVWGEGACTRNGLSNQAAMGEIASWGYFVVADGPPGSAGNCGSIGMSTDVVSMAKPLISYIDWAIAENDKPCSKYYQSLDTTKIAADGFSCGGLMAMGTAADPRMTAVGQTSSGLTSDVASYYKTVHTPFKVLVGGSSDQANPNGSRDYDRMSALGVPIIFYASLNAGHGGDLSNGRGTFNTINLAWLNWQLKGDTGATGKGFLVGSTCKYCTASGWQFKSANLP